MEMTAAAWAQWAMPRRLFDLNIMHVEASPRGWNETRVDFRDGRTVFLTDLTPGRVWRITGEGVRP